MRLEPTLTEQFGDSYRRYRAAVPRLVGARAWIGTVVFLILVPGTVAGLVPWLLLARSPDCCASWLAALLGRGWSPRRGSPYSYREPTDRRNVHLHEEAVFI